MKYELVMSDILIVSGLGTDNIAFSWSRDKKINLICLGTENIDFKVVRDRKYSFSVVRAQKILILRTESSGKVSRGSGSFSGRKILIIQ